MDLKLSWKTKIEQIMASVCFQKESHEIVGLNITCVLSKEAANFIQEYLRRIILNRSQFHSGQICQIFILLFSLFVVNLQIKSTKVRNILRLLFLLYKNYDVLKTHSVEYYLSSNGLVVAEKYRGQGIGEQLLRARETVFKEFGIRMTSSFLCFVLLQSDC